MKKGLLVVCTMISILLQVVSFSFRSDASSVSPSWVKYADGNSGTVTISDSSSHVKYIDVISGSQYLTDISQHNYTLPSGSSSGTVYDAPFSYYTGYIYRIYAQIMTLPLPDRYIAPENAQVYVEHATGSTTSSSGLVTGSVPRLVIGNIGDVLSGGGFWFSPGSVSWATSTDGNDTSLSMWAVFYVYQRSSGSLDYSFNVSFSYDGLYYRNFGTDASINQSLLDIEDAINQDQAGVVDAIQDQTQEVTEGYDNSQIEQSNTQLADSMQDYDSQQAEITDQATGYIDDVAFVDPSSQVQLAAAITYSASWLQSLFVNLGDWGILVVVSLSLAFAFMLIGWYKYRK